MDKFFLSLLRRRVNIHDNLGAYGHLMLMEKNSVSNLQGT